MFPYQNSNDEYFQTTDYVEQQENEVENQNNQVDSGLGGAEGMNYGHYPLTDSVYSLYYRTLTINL